MNYMLPQSDAAYGRFSTIAQSRPTRRISAAELVNLGNRYHRSGDLARAETVYRLVLEQSPNFPSALLSLGIIARQSQQYLSALGLMKRVVELAPAYHQAQNNLGTVYTDLGCLDDAIACFKAAIELKDDYAEAYFNLGVAHEAKREIEQALEAFSACRRLTPKRADLHYEIGQCEIRLGHRLEAQIAYKIALHIKPDYAAARDSLARVLASMGKYDEAIAEFKRAHEDDPDNVSAINGLAEACKRKGQFEEALELLELAYEANPRNLETLLNLGAVHQCMGDVKAASDYFEQILSIQRGVESAEKCILFAALNRTDLSSQELFDLHRRLRSHHDKPQLSEKRFADRSRDPDRKLRIGIISSDFRTHVVALNILPLIGNYDRARFEVILYAHERASDHLTLRFKENTDGFRSIERYNDAEAARIIEEDEIDILLTLAGRFDENRPLIASFRPAPIQVSFHDCATSGLDAMDYWLTDEILHPHDTPEKFTEQLYRLPTYYQYPIQDGLPSEGTPPVLRNGFITFGSFNKPEKINDDVIALWSEVLHAVPDSKLMLKYFSYYSEPTMQKRWLDRFARHGISVDRLILKAKIDDRPNHLMLYHDVDIALDPFPFNGATTTFEALTMSVPVLALLGRHFVDRVAASMVTHAGYPELVARNREDYIALARDLARDHDRLAAWRRTMRTQLHTSPLCDGPAYARNVEAAFRDMWRTWCETGGYRGK